MSKIAIFIVAIAVAVGYAIYLLVQKKRFLAQYAAAVVVVLIGAYIFMQDKSETNIHELLLAYHNGKPVICDGVKINNNDFNLVTGTNTFVGKQKSSYNGYAISIETCQIGEK